MQTTGQFGNGKTYTISGKELCSNTVMPDESIDEQDFEKHYPRVENEKLYLTIGSYNKQSEGGCLRYVFNYIINLKDPNLKIGNLEKWSNDDIYKIQLSAKNQDANYFSGDYNKDGFLMNIYFRYFFCDKVENEKPILEKTNVKAIFSIADNENQSEENSKKEDVKIFHPVKDSWSQLQHNYIYFDC